MSLPLVVMLVLGIVQIAVVTRDRTAMELAAREGARAAAVSANPTTAAQRAVDDVVSLDRTEVSVSTGGDSVTVTVTTVNQTDVALIGILVPDVTISGSATMALEPPDP